MNYFSFLFFFSADARHFARSHRQAENSSIRRYLHIFLFSCWFNNFFSNKTVLCGAHLKMFVSTWISECSSDSECNKILSHQRFVVIHGHPEWRKNYDCADVTEWMGISVMRKVKVTCWCATRNFFFASFLSFIDPTRHHCVGTPSAIK